jgi:hypothetical protein
MKDETIQYTVRYTFKCTAVKVGFYGWNNSLFSSKIDVLKKLKGYILQFFV